MNNIKPDLSVVILCYQAGEFVEQFTQEVINRLEKAGIINYEIVLVANYSDDRDITPEMVKKAALRNNKIIFVSEKKCGMMGWDMKSGLAKASGDYIAIIDGDGQMPTDDIIRVYNKIKEDKLDLVKTFRTKRGDTLWRKIISFFYNIFFHLLFPGLRSRDINSKPKIFTRQAYESFNLESDDWFIDAEIMIQARRNKLKIGELPTVFLGLSGRRSFVRIEAVFEFIKNLIIYRLKEFFK